jgi:hypothetical protein
MGGEDTDKESKLSHLIHAAANIMIMWTSQKLNKPELDTRHDWNNANPKQLPGSGITGEDLDKMAKEYYSKSNTEK